MKIITARPKGRTWFTADTHFGHEGVIRMCGRPFATAEEMDDCLVHAWNSVVGPNDEVWHLGDFAMGSSPERCAALFRRLRGHKHLVIGNHDRARTTSLAWESQHDLVAVKAETSLGTTSFVCCHYAMRSWPGIFRGALHLYGHTHATLPGSTRSCDVGVDAWGYRPVDVEDLLTCMSETDGEPEELALARGWEVEG